jgi:tryptophan synthase alpha chain
VARHGRVAQRFAKLRARNEAALIPFIVAGDPDMDTTRKLVRELEARGADLIELGVPFSDPMADGPVNQRAVARGMSSGASLAAILSLAADLRRETQIPLILFGYFNPYLHYGCERLCRDASTAGIDAILTVDLPPEESRELLRPARANGLDLIFLLAPTTPLERSRRIARSASGFLYYVSVTGVTGARAVVGADVETKVHELRSVTDLPIGVGFGISTPEQAAKVARFADAVVVGSAISTQIEQHLTSGEAVAAVGNLVDAMKNAMRAARTTASALAAN